MAGCTAHGPRPDESGLGDDLADAEACSGGERALAVCPHETPAKGSGGSASHGFHPAGVVTALTEQDSTQCAWMHPVSAEIVQNQLARLVDDCEIRVGSSTTTLHLQLADQAALHGLLQRIASFGLDLIDVSVVPPG